MGQGAYIFGCSGRRLSVDEKKFFARTQPWGFILFARNVETPEQLRALTSELRDTAGHNAPIMIDQEGGRVARLTGPHWRQWMPPMDQVKLSGSTAARSMWLRYRLIGEELRRVGIDCNCAPVVDIARRDTHPVLANRCYGTGAVQVAVNARAVADGLMKAGVLPVLKHMPGQGRALSDSHLSLPVVTATEKELYASDFAAFEALSDLPLAMTSHVVYGALDSTPATHSDIIIKAIRHDIGFQGVLMTDDIDMQALEGTLAERARRSLDAGCDLVLHCNGTIKQMDRVAGESGQMGRVSQQRADTALTSRQPADDKVDIAALEAELANLLGSSPYV